MSLIGHLRRYPIGTSSGQNVIPIDTRRKWPKYETNTNSFIVTKKRLKPLLGNVNASGLQITSNSKNESWHIQFLNQMWYSSTLSRRL